VKRSALKKQIISTFKPFDPEKIILFGSVARRESDEMSDVDLILVYNTDKRFMSRLKELYMSWDIPKAVDILAYTPSEFDDMVEKSLFLQEVMKTAEVIYERL
jgi:predicted nucleotidyltransferase